MLARAAQKRQHRDELVRVEEGRAHERVGRLLVQYYKPSSSLGEGELKCHVKCTIVDGDIVVLGSGNMDKASWYTSQELGIALYDAMTVHGIREALDAGMEGRMEMHYRGGSIRDEG